jgi:hypothetical protein
LSVQPAGNSPATEPWNITNTRSQGRRSSNSSEITSTAAPAAAARSTASSRFSLDFTSTPAVGSISTSSAGSLDSARAITTFCWLPPDRSATSWSGPDVLMARSSINFSATAARRRPEMAPNRPSRWVIGNVAFSAMVMPGTKPSLCRSSGTKPTPPASAAGTLPRFRVFPDTATVPASGLRRPTITSPSSTLPLLPEPAMPTTSPLRTDRSTPLKCLLSTRSRTSKMDSLAGVGRAEPVPSPTASPVIASTSWFLDRSATGLVTMCRASRNTVTVWQISKISWRWWEMNRNVTPAARSERIRSNSRSIAGPSSCAVGSSRMMNFAPNDRARAISTSWRCSTVRPAASLFGSTSTPYPDSSSPALRRSRDQLITGPSSRFCRLMNRFSATVSVGMMVDFW